MTDHPILPCGYNSWENDGDEVDGAGVNETIWPTYLNSFVPLQPIIMTDELEDIFEHGDPDLVFSCDILEITYPWIANESLAVNPWLPLTFQADDNVICFPASDQPYVVSHTWTDTAASPVANPNIVLPEGTRTQPVKEPT